MMNHIVQGNILVCRMVFSIIYHSSRMFMSDASYAYVTRGYLIVSLMTVMGVGRWAALSLFVMRSAVLTLASGPT